LKKIKVLFVLSLLVNILLVGAGSLMVYKQGGIVFLKEQMKVLTSSQKYSDYYLQKKKLFETLNDIDVDKIFLGDSITDHGEFQSYFTGEDVLNRGIVEDDTKGILNRLDEVVNRNPKEVYIMVGINDIGQNIDMNVYQNNIEKIVHSFDENSTKVILQSILPINNQDYNHTISNERIDQFNKVLKTIAEENGIQYVDLNRHFEDENGQLKKELTVDGIHLNGEGYDTWLKNLK